MIVRPMRGVAADLSQLSGNFLATPKIDGLRAWVKDGVVLSKTGKPIPSPTIQQTFGHLHGADGELVIGAPFRDLRNPDDDVYKRSRGPLMRKAECDEARRALFCIFDRWDMPDTPAYERTNQMTAFADHWPHSWVVPHVLVTLDGPARIEDYFAEAEQQGYEGAMLRRYDGIYKYGQSTASEGYLLKLKRFQHGEARIVGFVEGERNENESYIDEVGYTRRSSAKDGKVASGTLGAFEVVDLFSGVKFRVAGGKGMTFEFRRKVWDNQPEYLGKIVRYAFQEYGTDKAPRIPQFDGFRDEIDISDLERAVA